MRARKAAAKSAARSAPRSIDDYLARLDDDQRAILQKLRKALHAALPGAQECISYGVPALRLDGKYLLAFGAAARHCAFYPGAYPIEACAKDLRGYDISKGTVRFTPDKPLPAALVRKLARARVAVPATRNRKGVA